MDILKKLLSCLIRKFIGSSILCDLNFINLLNKRNIIFIKMKKLLFLLLLSHGIAAGAQEITMDLENFSEAEITNGLAVNFIQSEENKAVIKGNSRDKVKIDVENGVLDIQTDLNQIWVEDNTLIIIYYKQLEKVDARRNAKVELCGKITQPLIWLRAQEGSDITAQIEVNNLIANISTGGNLKIFGKADIQEIEVMAAGKFKGENLVGNTINVSISAGGMANVNAKKYVNANVNAGGNIYIYGNPEKVDKKTTFGGKIKKIN
jgi:hypothetical protein